MPLVPALGRRHFKVTIHLSLMLTLRNTTTIKRKDETHFFGRVGRDREIKMQVCVLDDGNRLLEERKQVHDLIPSSSWTPYLLVHLAAVKELPKPRVFVLVLPSLHPYLVHH